MNDKLLTPFFAAQFLTRIPMPFLNDVAPQRVKEILPQIHVWFPFIGGLIGLCTAIVYFILIQFFPIPLALLLALGLEILLTGAFHEDAFGDFCDGFGGGHSPEKVHEIMKDSRMGTYGVLGLIFAISIRFVATYFIPSEHLLSALLFSEAISRFMPLLVMRLVPQIDFNVKISKDVDGDISDYDIAKSLVISAPFWIWGLFVIGIKILILVILSSLFLMWFTKFLMRKLGGRNGDCLGFATYIMKIFCLLMFV